jgi:hypothetical protein
VGGPFVNAALASAICSRCSDQMLSEQGGVVLTLKRDLEGARFPLRKITITAGAVGALAESGEHAVAFLQRHARGDWGAHGHCDAVELNDDERQRGWEATDDPGKINLWNMIHGRHTINSEYLTGRGIRIWVVTRLDRSEGTTVLLPEEY